MVNQAEHELTKALHELSQLRRRALRDIEMVRLSPDVQVTRGVVLQRVDMMLTRAIRQIEGQLIALRNEREGWRREITHG